MWNSGEWRATIEEEETHMLRMRRKEKSTDATERGGVGATLSAPRTTLRRQAPSTHDSKPLERTCIRVQHNHLRPELIKERVHVLLPLLLRRDVRVRLERIVVRLPRPGNDHA